MNEQGKNPGSKIDQLLNEVGRMSEANKASASNNNNSDVKPETKETPKKAEPPVKTDVNTSTAPTVNKVGDEEQGKSKKGWYIGIAVILVIAVLAGVFVFFSRPLTDAQKEELYLNGTFVEGISVFDVDVSGETITSARAKLSDKVDFSGDQVLIELKLKEDIIPVKAADLHVENTVDSVLKEAMLYGREGNLFQKIMDKSNAKNNGHNFDIAIYTDETSLQNLVNSIVENYSVEVKDADIQINTSGDEKFTFVPEQIGIQISSDGLAEKIKSHIENKSTGYVELDYNEIAPKVTVDELKKNMVLRSTYSTNVSGASGRRKNIIKAASLINGKKVMPGETFDIEKELGTRSAANGWSLGGEYVNGVLVDGYGGGICQVSTTLFNAVLRSDLEIVERSNHSQPISYVKLGFDAAISDGGPYLLWKNTTDYPIFIFASATNSKITIDLYGTSLSYGENITYEERSSSSGSAETGRSVSSTLVFLKDGKEVNKISWSSYYRPKPVETTESTYYDGSSTPYVEDLYTGYETGSAVEIVTETPTVTP